MIISRGNYFPLLNRGKNSSAGENHGSISTQRRHIVLSHDIRSAAISERRLGSHGFPHTGFRRKRGRCGNIFTLRRRIHSGRLLAPPVHRGATYPLNSFINQHPKNPHCAGLFFCFILCGPGRI